MTEHELIARVALLERDVAALRAVEAQLRQRLHFLVETACPECERRERKAIKAISRGRR